MDIKKCIFYDDLSQNVYTEKPAGYILLRILKYKNLKRQFMFLNKILTYPNFGSF